MNPNDPMSSVASPRTRRQYRKSLAQEADEAVPTSIRHISSNELLEGFIDLATLHPTMGTRVEMFIVDIKHEEAFSVAQLRAALMLVPNVQELLLFLPSSVPADILADIYFHTLDFLATNIPHTCLATFLSDQSTLTSLILGPCGKSKGCPLSKVTMPNLMTLQCMISCLHSLPYQQVSRLVLDLPELGGCMPTVLRSMPKPPAALCFTSLTLDFFPDDYDILNAIVQAAPRIKHLKLVEKKKSARRGDSTGRRPWNSRSVWHKALCNLPLLEDLGIVTLSPFITGEPGRAAEELRFVLWWAGGASDRNGVMTDPHPVLHHIMLRYGAVSRTAGALSHWRKGNGNWTRVVTVVGPADMED